MAKETRRKQFQVLRASLAADLAVQITHWRDIADMVCPSTIQLLPTDTNRAGRRNQKIIDCTATLASRTATAGMMGGITSPARPWKRLTTPDPDLSEIGAVKEWLHTVDMRMSTIFLRSNLYNNLPNVYSDVLDFGTAAMMVEEDFNNVIRCYTFPIGSYMIALNDKLKVDVFFREFSLTVRQLVQRFGKMDAEGAVTDWSNFSVAVKNAYDNDLLDTPIIVSHIIQPNKEFNPKRMGSHRYESVYYEVSGDNPDVYLRDSGYDYFPVLCPRWDVRGEDIYGINCPGMVALGDIKQLQLQEKRGLQALEKSINPPMTGPSSLLNKKVSSLPGDLTIDDVRDGAKGFRPVYEIRPDMQGLEFKQKEVRLRISRAYYEDLFLMLANSDRRMITATEIDERKEEKLLVLGTVLSRLNEDLLDPLIDITFQMMVRQGYVPPAPPELQGVALKVEYVSIMHQAQKLAGLAGIERLAQFVERIAQIDPQILDKIDRDQMIDEYSEAIGIPPRIIVPDDKVAEIRAGRAQAQQAQVQAAQMAQGAATAKDLSGAKLDGNSALSALLKQSNAGSQLGGAGAGAGAGT